MLFDYYIFLAIMRTLIALRLWMIFSLPRLCGRKLADLFLSMWMKTVLLLVLVRLG